MAHYVAIRGLPCRGHAWRSAPLRGGSDASAAQTPGSGLARLADARPSHGDGRWGALAV